MLAYKTQSEARGQDYAAWLHNEIYGSKDILEKKLGINILAFAFPYGTHNEVVRKMGYGGRVLGAVHCIRPAYGIRCCGRSAWPLRRGVEAS
jgi:hypothetical protein